MIENQYKVVSESSLQTFAAVDSELYEGKRSIFGHPLYPTTAKKSAKMTLCKYL